MFIRVLPAALRFAPPIAVSAIFISGISALGQISSPSPYPAPPTPAVEVKVSATESSSLLFKSVDSGVSVEAVPDAPEAQATPAPQNTAKPADSTENLHQTKRILFIIPNFRSVSADAKLPPLSVKEKFKLFADDSFDYSAVAYVVVLAGMSDAQKSEPEFHGGAAAYGRYFWHGFADATDGNLMSEFLVPTVAHEDPRYYTLGHGGFIKRTVYSVSRLAITRSDLGHPTPNLAEIVGNGAAAGVDNFWYPSPERTWTKTGQRWALQVGVDGLSNLLKEFWPDINSRLFGNKF